MSNIDDIETVKDVDGEVVGHKEAFYEFKHFIFNMNLAAYEEAILRFGMTKREAKELCIPAKMVKDFKFKCYQPKPEELPEEVAEEVAND